jgi:hypothetical protein
MAGTIFEERVMATTATQIRKNSRRLDRINSIVSSILAAMQAGQSLHCEFGPRGPNWKLSNGRHLADEVARIVIANHSVAAVGDALWADATSQTWRYVSNE